MSRKDTFGNRVWRGDPKTVAEARTDFEKDPNEHLIRFAVALYSFRHKRRFANELVGLTSKLISETERMLRSEYSELEAARDADRMDVLSTHLEWISRYAKLPPHERNHLILRAAQLCEKGLSTLSSETNGHYFGHTRRLLALTKVRVLIAQGERPLAWTYLRWALLEIWMIQDLKQRARVYAKAGLLCRKLGRHMTGFSLGFRACTTAPVPFMVRVKSVVALAGFDR